MGSGESRFTVLLMGRWGGGGGGGVKSQLYIVLNPQLLKRRDPKRNQNVVLLLTGLTPYRWATQT